MATIFISRTRLQATGTFKIRGALYKLDKIIKEQKSKGNEIDVPASNIINDGGINNTSNSSNGDFNKSNLGIIAASAGNHAQGVALASKMNNLPCIHSNANRSSYF